MKSFKGKAIYNPSGKAGEYSYWACNFYKGCSGMCTYCFNKKGILKAVLGGDKPELKSCFADVNDAEATFLKEFRANIEELKAHGLFFSFTSDFFPGTSELLIFAIETCLLNFVPVKILTKQTDWITNDFIERLDNLHREIAFGFTLTGHDEMEQGCASNQSRIRKMSFLNILGFLTWASIEPIIDYKSSLQMIKQTRNCCDLYKIGLKSGEHYDSSEIQEFMADVHSLIPFKPIYWKDSLINQAKIKRKDLRGNCVDRDYNIFQNK